MNAAHTKNHKFNQIIMRMTFQNAYIFKLNEKYNIQKNIYIIKMPTYCIQIFNITFFIFYVLLCIRRYIQKSSQVKCQPTRKIKSKRKQSFINNK